MNALDLKGRTAVVTGGAAGIGLAIAQQIPAVLGDDLGVLARDLTAAEPQVVRFSPADRERQRVDAHDTLAKHVSYLQPGGGHT